MGNEAYPVAALENHVRRHERSQGKGGRRDSKVNMFISVPFGRVSRPPNLHKTVDHSNSLRALAFATAYHCPLSFNFPSSLSSMLTSEHICLLPPHGATPFLHFLPLSFVSGWSLSSQLSRLWCLSNSRLSDNVSIKWVFFRFTGSMMKQRPVSCVVIFSLFLIFSLLSPSFALCDPTLYFHIRVEW